jgi:simple sugar transport system substrate-binding protein/basic membrane protein A
MACRRPLIAMALAVSLLLAACSEASSKAAAPKIGFILIGQQDDLGYNQAIYSGSVAVARAFPDNEVLRTFGVPETSEAITAMEHLIDRGAKIIFATSYGHRDAAAEIARRHPNVIVVHQGGVKADADLGNFGTYWGTMYEPVYQAGIAAGAATKTNKLGFVAAFPIPATYNNIDAFTLAARSVNPSVTTQVVFTQNWCDPAKQADAAKQLLAAGVDVLAQHQDCTRTILEAAETAGVHAVGYHHDASEVAPKSWLVGAVWNWGDLFVDITRTALSGRFKNSPYDGNFRGGLKTHNNPFVLTEFNAGVSPAAQQAIQAASARFEGGHTPFDGPLHDREGTLRVPAGQSPSQAEIDSMQYFVPGVIGNPPS